MFTPANNPAGGGNEDVRKVTALALASASATILLGNRVKFTVVVVQANAATGTPTMGANIRFSNSKGSGSATATASDFMIPLNGSGPGWQFDTGDYYDTIDFFNNNSVTGATLDIYVMLLTV